MRNYIYNEALQINQDHVNETTDFMLIKSWLSDICRQQRELRDDPSQFREQNKINIFKKTLGMKYNTYRLIQMLDAKKRGKEPQVTKEFLFMQKAEAMLDSKTYNELMQIAEFGSIQQAEKEKKQPNKRKEETIIDNKNISKPIYNKMLGISTADVNNTTDIEQLTSWYTNLEFQYYLTKTRYKKTGDERLVKVINFLNLFKNTVYDRLMEQKAKMLKDAGISELEIDEMRLNFITRKFLNVAQRNLPYYVFEEILIASQI